MNTACLSSAINYLILLFLAGYASIDGVEYVHTQSDELVSCC